MRLAIVLSLLALPVFAQEFAPRQIATEFVQDQATVPRSFAGIVTARSETDLGFPLNGTITARPVSVGDIVAEGDVLARLDPVDLDADVRAAQAGVTVATAQLRAAANGFDRASQLASTGTDSAKDLEDAERALTAAQARVEQAQATLERARDVRGFAQLEAHSDGVITQVYEESGASVTAGQPVVRLSDTQGREIAIDLTEEDALELALGAEFAATLAANPKITAQARLTRIDPVAADTTRTRRVHLTLTETPLGFRLGALTRVVLVEAATSAVSIEATAILDMDTAPQVWVVDRGTNTVRLVPVEIGGKSGARVVVTAGLGVGDEVVTKGIHSLKDGQIVGPRVLE